MGLSVPFQRPMPALVTRSKGEPLPCQVVPIAKYRASLSRPERPASKPLNPQCGEERHAWFDSRLQISL